MTGRLHIAVCVVLYFTYLFLHNKFAVVLTKSFIRTHGHSHTKGCLPLSLLAASPTDLTNSKNPKYLNSGLVETERTEIRIYLLRRESKPESSVLVRTTLSSSSSPSAVVVVGVVLLVANSLT